MAPRRTNLRQLLLGLRIEVQALRKSLPDRAPAVERIWETLTTLSNELDGSDARPMDSARPAAENASSRLSLGPEAYWFRLDGGAPTNLRRRRALRRILMALAMRPRIAVSSEVLTEAGWPGERALPHAASARIRSAIATLRRLGLRHVLVTTGDGYMLDAEVSRVGH